MTFGVIPDMLVSHTYSCYSSVIVQDSDEHPVLKAISLKLSTVAYTSAPCKVRLFIKAGMHSTASWMHAVHSLGMSAPFKK